MDAPGQHRPGPQRAQRLSGVPAPTPASVPSAQRVGGPWGFGQSDAGVTCRCSDAVNWRMIASRSPGHVSQHSACSNGAAWMHWRRLPPSAHLPPAPAVAKHGAPEGAWLAQARELKTVGLRVAASHLRFVARACHENALNAHRQACAAPCHCCPGLVDCDWLSREAAAWSAAVSMPVRLCSHKNQSADDV